MGQPWGMRGIPGRGGRSPHCTGRAPAPAPSGVHATLAWLHPTAQAHRTPAGGEGRRRAHAQPAARRSAPGRRQASAPAKTPAGRPDSRAASYGLGEVRASPGGCRGWPAGSPQRSELSLQAGGRVCGSCRVRPRSRHSVTTAAQQRVHAPCTHGAHMSDSEQVTASKLAPANCASRSASAASKVRLRRPRRAARRRPSSTKGAARSVATTRARGSAAARLAAGSPLALATSSTWQGERWKVGVRMLLPRGWQPGRRGADDAPALTRELEQPRPPRQPWPRRASAEAAGPGWHMPPRSCLQPKPRSGAPRHQGAPPTAAAALAQWRHSGLATAGAPPSTEGQGQRGQQLRGARGGRDQAAGACRQRLACTAARSMQPASGSAANGTWLACSGDRAGLVASKRWRRTLW